VLKFILYHMFIPTHLWYLLQLVAPKNLSVLEAIVLSSVRVRVFSRLGFWWSWSWSWRCRSWSWPWS